MAKTVALPEGWTETAILLLLGFAPGYEPRYTVPLLVLNYGFGGFLVALLQVITLALALTVLVSKLWTLFTILSRRFSIAKQLYHRVLAAQRRAANLTSKYGLLGLIVFIALPIPVTGMYTGAAVALLLGMSKKQTLVALLVGGSLSATIVYIATVAALSLTQ